MGRDNAAVHVVDHRQRDEDVRAAALSFMRVMTGVARPTGCDRIAYDQAVESVAQATCCLLDQLDATSVLDETPCGTPGMPTAHSAGCRQLRAV